VPDPSQLDDRQNNFGAADHSAERRYSSDGSGHAAKDTGGRQVDARHVRRSGKQRGDEDRPQPAPADNSSSPRSFGARPEDKPIVRGSLRTDISTSSPELQAGTCFSLFVKVTNPFDVPIVLQRVTSIVPVEFIDVELKSREKRKKQSRPADAPEVPESAYAPRNPPLQSERMVVASIVPALFPMRLDHNEDPDHPGEAPPCACLLQPGDATVTSFTLSTNRAILFLPASYELPILVEYKIEGTPHRDSFRYKLNVRGPLRAVIAGAVCGALLGSLLHVLLDEKETVKLQDPQMMHLALVGWAVGIIANLLMSILLVVAFARKREAQPLITVEDFWGGCFLGALAAYGGRSMVTQVMSTALPPGAHL
jgi:hypothetical protein